MDKLIATKKITLATLKSFAKRNADKLFVKEESSFNGMTDCVEQNRNPTWKAVTLENAIGMNGVYVVKSSRDWFSLYDGDEYIGIRVYNCCGSGTLAIKK